MSVDKTITLGKMNRLLIDRFTAPGAYLMSENEEDVLLPNQYVTDEMKQDDEIDVFVYTDSEDRLVATTLKPKVMRDEFALLKCVDVTDFGAFMDWGLMKDLLVPKNRQKNPIKIGDTRFIRVIQDEKSERLIGVEKIGAFLSTDTKGLHPKDRVEILVIAKTPLGFKVIVENKFEGVLYENELFEKVAVGDRRDAYIKKIRSDGKLDLSLQAIGREKNSALEEQVLSLLKANKGILPYNSKSDAELIKQVFSMSKKNFKATLTKLRTENIIDVREDGIFLL